MSLCDRCVDPGRCCRDIILSVTGIMIGWTKLEALAWAASVQPCIEELGVPFLPHYHAPHPEFHEVHAKCPLMHVWYWECPRLTPEGRCGDYENRPRMCRSFVAGKGDETSCAMHDKACPETIYRYTMDQR